MRISTDTLQVLDDKAAKAGISRNELINQMILFALANMEEPERNNCRRLKFDECGGFFISFETEKTSRYLHREVKSIIFVVFAEILLQSFFHSNSHGDGHADHGVVACAQEAHYLNIKIHTGESVGKVRF